MLTRAWILDVCERAAMTALQAGLAVWVVTDTSTAKAAVVAAVAAGLSVIKGALATRVGNPDSAALLPKAEG